MSQWVIRGLKTGIKTTVYPDAAETVAGITPGLPCDDELNEGSAETLMNACPMGVFRRANGKITADVERCIHCYRCVRSIEHPAKWEETYEWAEACERKDEFHPAFKKSIHICVLDTGDGGACLNEVKQLNNPYYNMHRLGFFITPTPRHADVLIVVGTVTEHMKFTLKKVYEAMPTPKRVIAAGAAALSGGVFADSFVCSGIDDVLPVDVKVPGDPPPPLAILHGLLVAVGRKLPGQVTSEQSPAGKKR